MRTYGDDEWSDALDLTLTGGGGGIAGNTGALASSRRFVVNVTPGCTELYIVASQPDTRCAAATDDDDDAPAGARAAPPRCAISLHALRWTPANGDPNAVGPRATFARTPFARMREASGVGCVCALLIGCARQTALRLVNPPATLVVALAARRVDGELPTRLTLFVGAKHARSLRERQC